MPKLVGFRLDQQQSHEARQVEHYPDQSSPYACISLWRKDWKRGLPSMPIVGLSFDIFQSLVV